MTFANSVMDGADAVMLLEATGNYPVQVIEKMTERLKILH
jgi:pyruvate kinase